jgi:Coenzyme PQQ synthesis protein D (PqqD)
MAEIVEETRVSRNPAILAAEVDSETVIMSIAAGRYYGLDDIGTVVWKRIDPPCSFRELVDGLAADYEADRATIAFDVRALLDRMVQEDVVRID